MTSATSFSAAPLSARSLVLLALAALVLWFANLDYRKLIKPDEGRYAEISREMAVTGDWVTPRLNGIRYFEKPPLHYWAGAAAFAAFGAHEWAARLWSAITGMLTVILAWYAGGRLFGRTAGLYAGVLAASSLMLIAVAHLNTLDMGLTFFLFLSLCGFIFAQRDGATARDNTIWMHVGWAAMACAMLSKGLVGVVIPGATLVLYVVIQRDWKLLLRLRPLTGAILFLAIAAPWFVLVSQRNPQFAWFFFVHEHFLRYTTTLHQRSEPWYYFLPLLVAGGLPWTVTLFDAARRSWAAQPDRKFQVRRFLLVWCAFVLLFFSASGSKLPPYILPLFPALALLGGWRLAEIRGRTLFWQLSPLLLLGVGALAALPFVHSSGDTPAALIESFKPWLTAAASVTLIGTGYAMWNARRDHIQRAVIGAGLAALVSAQMILTGHNALAPSMSGYAMAQQVKPYLKPGIPFYSVGTYDQTLDFYLDRTVTLVQFRDELDFGLQLEPQLGIDTVAQWLEIWRGQPYALALIGNDLYEQLSTAGFPMTRIAQDTRRSIIKTP